MRSVHRAFDVLRVLELAQRPLRLTEVAHRAELHVATTQRLVTVLTDHGYASRHADGYTAGPAALSTAHAFATTSPLRLIARPVLEQLADSSGFTVSLYVRVQDHRVLIDRVERGQRPQYSLPIGERLPLYPGAAGKAFLLHRSSLDTMPERLAPITLADGAELDAEQIRDDLVQARANGFATSIDERKLGITAIAVPVVDGGHQIVASIGISANTSELPDVTATALPDEARRAAQTIGARVPSPGNH